MLDLLNLLHRLGENARIKDKTIVVKFSIMLGQVSIKRDIATKQLDYSYQQTGDFVAAICMFTMAGFSVEQQNYALSSLIFGIGFLRLTASIIKEIKVTAIKREINALALVTTNNDLEEASGEFETLPQEFKHQR